MEGQPDNLIRDYKKDTLEDVFLELCTRSRKSSSTSLASKISGAVTLTQRHDLPSAMPSPISTHTRGIVQNVDEDTPLISSTPPVSSNTYPTVTFRKKTVPRGGVSDFLRKTGAVAIQRFHIRRRHILSTVFETVRIRSLTSLITFKLYSCFLP